MAGESSTTQPDSGFDVVRRGYDQAQVDSHLARLDAELRILTTDRLAAVDQASHLTRELDEARARTDRLRAQVRTLVSPPQSVQGMSERMRSMLRMAEDEVAEMHSEAETAISKRLHEAELRAAQIVAAAQAEADTTVATARAEADSSTQEIARLRAELEAGQAAAQAALAAERADIDQRVSTVVGEAERDRERAWAESESRRAQVEEDFRLAMDQRRAEALATLTAENLQGRRDVEEQRRAAAVVAAEVVEQAHAQARRIVADAEHRIVELTALRRRIVEQLGGTKAVLERTIGDLGLLPEELPPGADATTVTDLLPAGSAGPVVTTTARDGQSPDGQTSVPDPETARARSASSRRVQRPKATATRRS